MAPRMVQPTLRNQAINPYSTGYSLESRAEGLDVVLGLAQEARTTKVALSNDEPERSQFTVTVSRGLGRT